MWKSHPPPLPSCSVLAAPAVPTHGPVPRPCHPGEGLVPGTDGPQRQRSQLCLAGPLPALLPPASTQCYTRGVPGRVASPRGRWGTQLWVPMVGCGHPAPPLSPQGLQDCVADLLQPFQGDAIDMVAGIDAMGFILGEQDAAHGRARGPCPLSRGSDGAVPPPGAAAAAALRKGFLAIRKAGHLCVQTAAQPYSDYSGREKVMEVRTDAISPGEPAGCSPSRGAAARARGAHPQPLPPPGLRILLVDQWVETGGTMRAAIELVERLGGVVAGRRGHPSAHHRSHGLWWPALSPPVCPHRCRCHLRGEQRGREVDPGALQVLPLCPPPPAAPLRPAPLWLGLMWECHLVCPLQPPEGHRAAGSAGQGCSSVEKELIFSGSHPSSGFPMSLGAAPRDRKTHSQSQPPAPSPTPFLQSIKKDFIKTKGSLRTSPPASSTWVCIATGATRALLPAPARGAQAGDGLGGLGVAGTSPRGRPGSPLFGPGV